MLSRPPVAGTPGSLILVRHSLPAIDPAVPASQWSLSAEGRRRCAALAGQLAGYALEVVVSSVEPKAQETARVVAGRLGLPLEVVEGLHEHSRRGLAWTDRATFQAAVADLMARPGELVMGEETADQAHRRFRTAVLSVLERHPARTLAVVTHGTVMSLLVARANGLDPLPFWRRLGMPAFAVLSRPALSLVECVECVQ